MTNSNNSLVRWISSFSVNFNKNSLISQNMYHTSVVQNLNLQSELSEEDLAVLQALYEIRNMNTFFDVYEERSFFDFLCTY